MVGWFSKFVVAATVRMPKWFVRWVSRRYVAGASLDEAVAVMKRLTQEGACFTIDVLGEEISSMDEATFFLEEYIRVMKVIKQHDFDANISIKPTAFGLLIDPEQGLQNIRKLVKMAAEENMFVRLDMEDHRVTTDTINVVITLHNEGLTNVGTVLQGRLFRTLSDIGDLETTLGPNATIESAKVSTLNQRRFRLQHIRISSTGPTQPSIGCLRPVRMSVWPLMTSPSSTTRYRR